jgi:2Fe-2S ferredoxin
MESAMNPDHQPNAAKAAAGESPGPARTYRITFLPLGKTIEVGEPNPAGHHEGLPGSVLDWADKHDIPLDHACGGFAACSTCHVIVRKGLDSCNETSEDEDDMLDEAAGVTLQSRLACQCIPDGREDLVVEIPSWNRNEVKEGHR